MMICMVLEIHILVGQIIFLFLRVALLAAFAWCVLPRIEIVTYRTHLQIMERSRLVEVERTDERLLYNNIWIGSLALLSEVGLTHSF